MIKAPYNFVPLSTRVYYPKWSEQVSNDIPFTDGEDGIIELTLHNETAFFTRNGHKRDVKERYSSHIINGNGGRQYFIPGSTIKGAARSIMEILSSAKIGLYDNDSFAMPRAFDTKVSTNKPYIEATKNVKNGWMVQTESGYVIYPCSNVVLRISHDDIKKRFPGFNVGEDHKTAEIKQKSLQPGGEYFPILRVEDDEIEHVPSGVYRVVCTGFMAGKKNEYLFNDFDDRIKPIIVSDEVFRTFESVHKKTVYYYGHGDDKGKLKTMLYSGKQIPVFYTIDNNEVKAIGITYKLRVPYEFNVKNAIRNARLEEEHAEKPDLPETIFGYIGDNTKDKSLKSRVMFGNAFCNDSIDDSKLVKVEGVLGQPSASFYPLYVKQSKAPFITWHDVDVSVAGRKRYRVSMGGQTFPLPQNKNNEDVMESFLAIPAGHSFTCRIVVHNLRKVEIGALISSLTMNNTNGCFLNIGLAKSFGFGKMRSSISLKGLNYNVEEYIYAFEQELMKEGFELADNDSINAFASIASEHAQDSMSMMSLQEYDDAKNNNAFSTLSELKRSLNTYLSKQDFEKERKEKEETRIRRINQMIEDADNMVNDKLFEKALDLYREAKTMGGTCETKINNCIQAISNAIVSEADEARNKGNYSEAIEIYRRAEGYGVISCSEQIQLCERKMSESSMGLSELVNITKDSSIAAIAGKIKKYSGEVTAGDCVSIGAQLKEAYPQMNSKNKKAWGEFKNWKPIIEALQSEDKALSIFKHI